MAFCWQAYMYSLSLENNSGLSMFSLVSFFFPVKCLRLVSIPGFTSHFSFFEVRVHSPILCINQWNQFLCCPNHGTGHSCWSLVTASQGLPIRLMLTSILSLTFCSVGSILNHVVSEQVLSQVGDREMSPWFIYHLHPAPSRNIPEGSASPSGGLFPKLLKVWRVFKVFI